MMRAETPQKSSWEDRYDDYGRKQAAGSYVHHHDTLWRGA
jgi:hypothetical protein